MRAVIKAENRTLCELNITAYDYEEQRYLTPEDLKYLLSLIRDNKIEIDNSDDNEGGVR